MLHDLLRRRSPEALWLAQEHAAVEPQLRYLMVSPHRLVFVLQDGNSITLHAPGLLLQYEEQPPVQMQFRKLMQVNIVGSRVEINLGLTEVTLVAYNEDGTVAEAPEWGLSVEGNDQLRRQLTNRFLMNGQRWKSPITLSYRPWRPYDDTSIVHFEESETQSVLPKARDGEAQSPAGR